MVHVGAQTSGSGLERLLLRTRRCQVSPYHTATPPRSYLLLSHRSARRTTRRCIITFHIWLRRLRGVSPIPTALSSSCLCPIIRYLSALVDPVGSSYGTVSEAGLAAMLQPYFQKDPFLPAQVRC